jgi:hypothetical protein
MEPILSLKSNKAIKCGRKLICKFTFGAIMSRTSARGKSKDFCTIIPNAQLLAGSIGCFSLHHFQLYMGKLQCENGTTRWRGAASASSSAGRREEKGIVIYSGEKGSKRKATR